jgi:hypothetical protein
MLIRSGRVAAAAAAIVVVGALVSACGGESAEGSEAAASTTAASSSSSANQAAGAPEATVPEVPEDYEPNPDPVEVGQAETTYIDALRAAGIEVPDDELAMSVGQYVCESDLAGGDPEMLAMTVTAMVGVGGNYEPDGSGAKSEEQAAAEAQTYIDLARSNYCA